MKRTQSAGLGVWWVLVQVILLIAIAVAPGSAFQWRSPASFILVAAAAILVSAVLAMGGSLSPFPAPATRGTLITGGIFRFIRHPIYTAVIIGAIAFAQGTHSLARLVLALVLVVFFSAKAGHEESLLKTRYPAYEPYAARTKRFVPWIY